LEAEIVTFTNSSLALSQVLSSTTLLGLTEVYNHDVIAIQL